MLQAKQWQFIEQDKQRQPKHIKFVYVYIILTTIDKINFDILFFWYKLYLLLKIHSLWNSDEDI